MRRGRSCAALRVLLLALCVTESAAPHHPAASPATAAEAAALEAALAQRSGPPAVAVKGVDEAWTAAPGGATQQHSPSSPAPPQPGLGGPRGECSPREAADGCHYVRTEPACQNSEQRINYLELHYCSVVAKQRPEALAVFALLAWMLLVFLALTLSAELYFAPAVGNIARWLALSEDVAGATLLAFGNGAPDFFTQVAALTYGDDVDLPLALGEGIGAGLYVSCFCLGCALLTGPPTGVVVPLLPFVRDAVTYLGALLMVMGAAKDNIVTGGEAAVMLAWYALYVCAVLQGERIARFLPARWSAVHSTPVGVGSGLPHARISEVELAAPAPANRLEGGPGEEHVASLTHSAKRHGTPHAVSATEEPPLPLSLPPGHDEESPSGTLSHLPAPSEAPLAGTPRQQVHAWALRYSGLRDPEASRALLPLSVPVRLLIACTMADPDSGTVLPLHVALIALCLPSFLLFAGGVGVFAVHSTGLALLAFARVALACAALSLLPARGIDARTSYAVSACAFLGGLAWMDVCADEIVAIFQTLGRILGFPETLLGGTIMCWAASMGDLFSMLAVVRCGFLQMAVTSCFAGPLFQLLCGLGVSLLFINVKAGGGPVEMRFGTELRVMLAFGVVALCYYAVGVPTLHRCHLTRRFGWGMLSAYVAFIVVYSAAGLESYNGG